MHLTARTTLMPLLLAVVVGVAEAGSALPKQSPFELRGEVAAPVATAHETIEFAGVSLMGDETDLIFYDKASKKSHWISPGETKEGIAVIEYDERRDEVVVKVDGLQKTLALRKASAPAGSPRPVPALPGGFNTPVPVTLPATYSAQAPAANGALPSMTNTPNATGAQPATAAPSAPAHAPGSPAAIQARQETEARMLVSDLLEIGMAQRRAYEEAQRKAAAGNAPNAEPAEAPQAGATQPAQPNQ